MTPDDWVALFVAACLVFGLGWETRAWSDAQKPVKIEIRRVELATPAHILGCPMSARGLAEWREACHKREIANRIKQREKTK